MNVNAADSDGWSALHFAASCGHLEIVQELLKHPKIDVNGVKADNLKALQLAEDEGHADILYRYCHSGYIVRLRKRCLHKMMGLTWSRYQRYHF
jgi:ankyrin repeat protein